MRNNYAWCVSDEKYAEIITKKKNPKHIDEELDVKNEDLDENKINIEPVIFLPDNEEGITGEVTLSKLQETQQTIIEKGCNIGLNFEKAIKKLVIIKEKMKVKDHI